MYVFTSIFLGLAQILKEPLILLWGIEGLWVGIGCAVLVFCIVSFLAVIVYGYISRDPVKQTERVEATGKGDIEKGLVGDAGGNGDTKVREGEESGAQVDKRTRLKSQISG